MIPGKFGFQSAHALINRERVKRRRSCLKRCVDLDRLCQARAQALAQAGQLSHSVATKTLRSSILMDAVVGENVQRGASVSDMHHEAMARPTFMKNILNDRFCKFGVATALGKQDGKLYMVQMFRGNDEDEEGGTVA